MRAVIIATVAAVIVAFWLFAPHPLKNVSKATLGPAPTISYWDAHNQAHLGPMPVQHFEDLSLVFTESGDNPAPAARLVWEDAGQR